MPDYIYKPGYTVNGNNRVRSDIPIGVMGGALNVVKPPAPGTDRSVVAGVASTQLMAANTARMGFYVKNDTAIDVWINIGAAAVATPGGGNIKIPANGGYFETGSFVPADVVNIIASSATAAITAREF